MDSASPQNPPVLPPDQLRAARRLFIASAWAFVLAAALGALFRFGIVRADFGPLQAGDLRHAHSHLMLMGWATPALIALITARAPALGLQLPLRATLATGWGAWALALLSTPAFALYGYRAAAIGEAKIPIAAALSGLAMGVWYVFAALVWRALWRARAAGTGHPALRIFSVATLALVVSSAGAWALAAQMITGRGTVLSQQLAVHFFVDLFGIGWLLGGALALLRAELPATPRPFERGALGLLAAGAPLLFLAGMPPAALPPLVRVIGHLAAALSAAGLIALAAPMGRPLPPVLRSPLALLLLSATMLAALASPPVAAWGQVNGLRLLFLHVAFAGALTLTLITLATRRGLAPAASPRLWGQAMAALLLTLVPLTGAWPSFIPGGWETRAALAGALIALALSAGATFHATFLARSPRPSRGPA
ncbi:hypothetical protein DL240_16475 [Lujinxingia litoralis]|uniref:Cytochrome oxidase subunit I profile domain-containing protein n=1 Tax=Lujinxingia litoralis TaxID=2211119 RepID=A0A328C3W9_9DELT|nr:hypothetical protein [Lujinxingia litoralis]RAL20626.1 hypothetical protein DL240_16475 [Lujinxingia litoralis]